MDGQHATGCSHAADKVAGELGQSCNKEIAKGMTIEPGTSPKMVLEKKSRQRLRFRERRDTAPQVAWRQHASAST